MTRGEILLFDLTYAVKTREADTVVTHGSCRSAGTLRIGVLELAGKHETGRE